MFFLSTYFVPFLNFFCRKGFEGWCQTYVAKINKRGGLNKARGSRKKIEKLINVPPSIKHPRVILYAVSVMFIYPQNVSSPACSFSKSLNAKIALRFTSNDFLQRELLDTVLLKKIFFCHRHEILN